MHEQNIVSSLQADKWKVIEREVLPILFDRVDRRGEQSHPQARYSMIPNEL